MSPIPGSIFEIILITIGSGNNVMKSIYFFEVKYTEVKYRSLLSKFSARYCIKMVCFKDLDDISTMAYRFLIRMVRRSLTF